jgi:Mrp family chromosome partitioning ATPase
VLLRRWPIIAVGVFIGAAFAFVGTDPKPQPIQSTYTATHTLLVTEGQFQFGSQSLVGTVTFAQIPVFATTGEIPRLVAENLGYDGAPASLAAQITVEDDAQTGTLRFTTEQEVAEDAVRIADAFADETVRYLSLRQDELRQARQTSVLEDVQQLEAEIRELDQQIALELTQLNADRAPEAPLAEADPITRARRDAAVREYSTAYEAYRALVAEDVAPLNLTTLERAQPVHVQSGGFTPPRTRSTRVPIAAGIGGALGAAVALLVERLDARVRDRRKVEEAFGASVVGELPTLTRKQRAARLVVGPEEHHAAAEAFRSLRTSITFMAADGRPLADNDRVGAILVTSPSPTEGKTTIAVNLAAAFAETGRSVVVVNADFRRPLASKILTDERPPLPAGLTGIDRLDPSAFLAPTKVPGVTLLDLSPLSGTPGDLTRATVRLVTALAERVDVLVIDTPPLVVTTEALEFVPAAKVVVLVARIGRTTTAAAQRAGELARFGGAQQVAVAMNDTGSTRLRRQTYYDYYGGRRNRRHETPAAKPAPDAADVPDEARDRVGGDVWHEIDELVERHDGAPAPAPDDSLPASEHSPPPR